MKHMKLLCAFLILQSANNCIKGYSTTGQQIIKPITSISDTSGDGSDSQTTANQCPKPTSCNTSAALMPALQISMFDSNSSTTPVSNFTFTPNSDFTVSSAMLIVHVFPPSNIITNRSITKTSDDNSYAIMYTLKALDGSILQKQLQYLTPATTTTPVTPEVDIMPISKNTPIIPVSISIATITPGTSASGTAKTTAATLTQLLGDTPLSFLPDLSKLSVLTQQRIFNGISPMSLKFYLYYDQNNNLQASPISGMFDSSDGSTLTSSLIGTSQTIKSTPNSTTLQSISVNIADTASNTTTITFNASTSTDSFFNQTDLAQGLSLNIHIYPPSTSGSNYFIIATLRSLDGLKLRKKVVQGVTFTGNPSQFTINYAGSNPTTILSSTFANSSLSSYGNALNIISPINLRCLLHQNTASGTFMVSIV